MAASDLAQTSTNPGPEQREEILAMGERLFGTGSPDFQRTLLRQVHSSLWLPSSQTPDQRKAAIRAALWALKEIVPSDAAEGLLAAQMVATHNGAMECFRRAMAEGQTFEGRDVNLKHAQRLSKTYLDQLAALDKHRGRGQQTITVKRVNVEAGGQAIVGSVQTSMTGGPAQPRAPHWRWREGRRGGVRGLRSRN
ncbi:hypothetical protein [Oceanicaulis alexandrii]|uniref:hypothetical protein n=1 Tax=Oceanicaulis alexandrii TaxID=153233 RepID=UPI0023555886|nr:hypothetical protein [Oceanicaulis alexandrii]